MHNSQEDILNNILIPFGVLHGIASPLFIIHIFDKYDGSIKVDCEPIKGSNNLLLTYDIYQYILEVDENGYVQRIQMC